MPTSKAQQNTARAAYGAVKKGKAAVDNLKGPAKDMAKSMTKKELRKMATGPIKENIEEAPLNEAQLANNVYFWLVEKPTEAGADPATLVYPSRGELDKKEYRGMDPFEFGRMVIGGATPDQIHGFYLSEEEANKAAEIVAKQVNEAAKALEEKKAMVTTKIEEVIKKLQEKVNSCMEEGRDEEAQMYLEKIKDLRSKNEIVEASKKQVEKLEEGWFDRQVASAKGTGAALGTGIRNIGRAIMGNDTKSIALAKNVAKLNQKAKTLDKAIADMENDMNVLFSPDKLNSAPEDFKKTLNNYRATLKQVKSINGAFMKGGTSLPTDQKPTADQSTQGGSSQQTQSSGGSSTTQQTQSSGGSQSTSGGASQSSTSQSTTQSTTQQQPASTKATTFKSAGTSGKEYEIDKTTKKVRVTMNGKRVRLSPINYNGKAYVPLVRDPKGKVRQVKVSGNDVVYADDNQKVDASLLKEMQQVINL